MRYSGLGLLLLMGGCGAFAGAADSHARPACNAANVGRYWPAEANDNPKFAAALMHYGYPEVCTLRKGSYGWRSLTLNVNQLRTDAGRTARASSIRNRKDKTPNKE